MLHLLIQYLVRLAPSSRRESRRQRPSRRRCLPRLELLEDRTVPSVLYSSSGSRHVQYGGGPIIHNADVDLIFWGAGWNSTSGSAFRTQVQNNIDTLLASPFMSGLSQYGGIGQATRTRSDTIATTSPASVFSNTSVQNMLSTNINNNTLPSPASDSQLLYMVIPQPGSTAGSVLGEHSTAVAISRYHYGWTINNSNMDTITNVFSHELAEAVTDSEVNVHNGYWVPTTNDEIGDGEAQNYTYRLNGILVQSTLSEATHSYDVYTGQTQNLIVSSTHVLTVNGDQLADHNDNITIDKAASSSGVVVTVNGEQYSFEPGSISSVVVNPGTGDDTINIEHTVSGVPVTVNLGNGNDTVNISPTLNNLSNILGNVTIHAGSGADTVNVDDQSTNSNQTFTMGANTVTRTGSALISYGPGIQFVNINGGNGSKTYNITGTETNGVTTLNTGDGNDTVNVQATTGVLNINEGNGNDTVNISSSAHNLNTIQGAVNIAGGAGNEVLVVSDQSNSSNLTYTMTATSLSRPGAAAINYVLMTSVTLNGGTGSDTYNVNGTGGLNFTTLNTGSGPSVVNVIATTSGAPLTINEGVGTDTVNISPSAQDLDNIQGAVTVNGSIGLNFLTINDQNNGTAQTYTMTATSVARTGAATITFGNEMKFVTLSGSSGADTYSITGAGGLFSTTLNDGVGNNTVNVQATSGSALIVNTGLYDTIYLGSAGNTLDPIGAVTVNDATGTSVVAVEDFGFAGTEGYTITSTTLTIGRSAGFSLTYSGIAALYLNTGAGSDLFAIDSTSAATIINAGSGGNIFRVSPFTQALAASMVGPLTLNGGGADILEFFDASDPSAETFNFDSVPASLTLGSTGSTICNFSGMGTVYVMTNGSSLANDQSGTVIFDPAGGRP
jgi:hypothetical protein